jgi:hypothetical protein
VQKQPQSSNKQDTAQGDRVETERHVSHGSPPPSFRKRPGPALKESLRGAEDIVP